MFPGPEPEYGGGKVAYWRGAGDRGWRGQRLWRPCQGVFGPYPIGSKRGLWKVFKARHDPIRSERYTHIHTLTYIRPYIYLYIIHIHVCKHK